jgi:integrase
MRFGFCPPVLQSALKQAASACSCWSGWSSDPTGSPTEHSGTEQRTEKAWDSVLFALRWRSFDDLNTLEITETVYRRKLRQYGKTPGSLTKVHLPEGLANELRAWKIECGDVSPDNFIFPNADGGILDSANYRFRVLKPLADALGIERLNFQILRRTMATHRRRAWVR